MPNQDAAERRQRMSAKGQKGELRCRVERLMWERDREAGARILRVERHTLRELGTAFGQSLHPGRVLLSQPGADVDSAKLSK